VDAGGDAGASDGGADAPSSVDAGADASRADSGSSDAGGADAGALGPFGAPVRVAALDTPASEDDPSLTGDMLEIFFNSARSGGAGSGDIWTSTRERVDAPWAEPTPVTALNAASEETSPEVSLDGSILYFTRYGGAGGADVYVTTRTSRSAPWGMPSAVPELNTTATDWAPSVTADGLTAYMASSRSGSARVWRTTRSSTTAPWRTPTRIDAVGAGPDYDPYVAGDELSLLFTSYRGASGDIYAATRATTAVEFGDVAPVEEVNTASDENDPWLSPDGRTLFFNSDRSGDDAIWTATR
jgi:hypothetical protein